MSSVKWRQFCIGSGAYLYLYLMDCICICICIWSNFCRCICICICIWNSEKNIFVFVFVFDKPYLTPAPTNGAWLDYEQVQCWWQSYACEICLLRIHLANNNFEYIFHCNRTTVIEMVNDIWGDTAALRKFSWQVTDQGVSMSSPSVNYKQDSESGSIITPCDAVASASIVIECYCGGIAFQLQRTLQLGPSRKAFFLKGS